MNDKLIDIAERNNVNLLRGVVCRGNNEQFIYLFKADNLKGSIE